MRVESSFTSQTNLQHQNPHIYFRSDRLAPTDQRDLEVYAEHLRAYYGIPAGRPVFPKRTPTKASTARRPSRRATGLNRADHPWRGTL